MEAEELRAEQLERWARAAAGWARRAERLRETSLPVSRWMVQRLELEPGQRVLELAAGPGDTGFLAARSIVPGTLISSDASEAMLELARSRAREQGVENVEFAALQLEWIDLPAASVDAVLCRWGLMLVVDPGAAASEMRRVLRPNGRLAVAVWDVAERNPWATIPGRALVELGHADPPDPSRPGMFALAPEQRLRELLERAGFLDVALDGIELDRAYRTAEDYVAETVDLSAVFAEVWERLDERARAEVRERIDALTAPYANAGGSLRLPGRSLVAAASA
ncbi:MAG: methyltransferase domain-containing protein [Solirubrobacterales bacterium]|nr:methyltransferase domain-containing protein [Solirubrobacterales bacterium]MBV9166981.1 methyltransferase domain-containing protein [Solirubrobacterales bacterium]MBV9536789.1 methyltransferase domain-containing protein [Solirubrobacterales bacterium]